MSGDLLENEPGEKKTQGPPSRPTICAECDFYNEPSGQNPTLCGCPMFAIPPQYDLVTGRVLNQTKPKCVDTNKGSCPGFRNTWKRRAILGSIAVLVVTFAVLAALVMAIGSQRQGVSAVEEGVGRGNPSPVPSDQDGRSGREGPITP